MKTLLYLSRICILLLASLSSGSLFAAQFSTFDFKVAERGDSKKPSVILIPGLMSDASVYDNLSIALQANYQVHTLSVRGFAETPPTDEAFSLQALVDDILLYSEYKNLEQPHIIGHSMGGLTAFILAAQHEDKIGKVISIDGLPFIGPIFTGSNQTSVDDLQMQAQMMQSMFERMTSAQLAAQTKMGLHIQATAERDKARVLDMAQRSDAKTVGEAMYSVMTTDMRKALESSNTSILLLGASGAFTTSEQHAATELIYKEQFNAVKNAKVVMNTSSRHFMMFDQADWVSIRVLEFLGESI
jgi:pimeloyl-ACP methyl ester carboxylesterase